MKQFDDVSSKYGAPMGRSECGTAPDAARTVRLFRVRLDSGGYDDGGAYWGSGEPLFCATDGGGFRRFVRAASRFAAMHALALEPRTLVSPARPQNVRHWCDSYGRLELAIPLDDARACSHSGDCSGDVAALAARPDIAAQLQAMSAARVRVCLAEYGTWDAAELRDHGQNLERLLWLACGDISDNEGAAQ